MQITQQTTTTNTSTAQLGRCELRMSMQHMLTARHFRVQKAWLEGRCLCFLTHARLSLAQALSQHNEQRPDSLSLMLVA